MRNPLKRYYFLTGTNMSSIFDCTYDIWLWQNPQDMVEDALHMWRKQYGKVSITGVTKL